MVPSVRLRRQQQRERELEQEQHSHHQQHYSHHQHHSQHFYYSIFHVVLLLIGLVLPMIVPLKIITVIEAFTATSGSSSCNIYRCYCHYYYNNPITTSSSSSLSSSYTTFSSYQFINQKLQLHKSSYQQQSLLVAPKVVDLPPTRKHVSSLHSTYMLQRPQTSIVQNLYDATTQTIRTSFDHINIIKDGKDSSDVSNKQQHNDNKSKLINNNYHIFVNSKNNPAGLASSSLKAVVSIASIIWNKFYRWKFTILIGLLLLRTSSLTSYYTVTTASIQSITQIMGSWYIYHLTTNPIVTKSVSAGMIASIADYAAQWIEHLLHTQHTQHTQQQQHHQKEEKQPPNGLHVITENEINTSLHQQQPLRLDHNSNNNNNFYQMNNENLMIESKQGHHFSRVATTAAATATTLSLLPSTPSFSPSIQQQQPVQFLSTLSVYGKYDKRRGISTLLDGLLITGPLMHLGYEFFESVIPIQSGCSNLLLAPMLHVLADSIFLDSFFIASKFFTTGIMEGISIKELKQQFTSTYIPSVKASWITSIVLCPIQFSCFRYLPIHFRVLSVNLIDVVWDAVLSFMTHRNRQ